VHIQRGNCSEEIRSRRERNWPIRLRSGEEGIENPLVTFMYKEFV